MQGQCKTTSVDLGELCFDNKIVAKSSRGEDLSEEVASARVSWSWSSYLWIPTRTSGSSRLVVFATVQRYMYCCCCSMLYYSVLVDLHLTCMSVHVADSMQCALKGCPGLPSIGINCPPKLYRLSIIITMHCVECVVSIKGGGVWVLYLVGACLSWDRLWQFWT